MAFIIIFFSVVVSFASEKLQGDSRDLVWFLRIMRAFHCNVRITVHLCEPLSIAHMRGIIRFDGLYADFDCDAIRLL